MLNFLHCFTVLCLWPSRPRGLTQANRRTGNASRTLSRHWVFFLILESWLCATYALMTYQNPQILAVLIKVNLLQVYSMYTGIQSSPSCMIKSYERSRLKLKRTYHMTYLLSIARFIVQNMMKCKKKCKVKHLTSSRWNIPNSSFFVTLMQKTVKHS